MGGFNLYTLLIHTLDGTVMSRLYDELMSFMGRNIYLLPPLLGDTTK
jgi:hypothetical protein